MKFLHLILVLCAAFGLYSCKDWNMDELTDEEWLRLRCNLKVSVSVDDSFAKHLDVDSVFTTRSEGDDVPYLRYYVAVYPEDPRQEPVFDASNDSVFNLRIPLGRHHVTTWVDYEVGTRSRGVNFYTDDFSELLLRNKYNYSPGHVHKLGFRGIESLETSDWNHEVALSARPAMALYKLVATDTPSYEPGKVVIRYGAGFPSAIDLHSGNINWWWNDISYSSSHKDEVIATDYVLSQDSQTEIKLSVEIYDTDGNLRARKLNLVVPLRNGGITTLSGNFFSVFDLDPNESHGGNGISIKTEWDATFDIEI